mmetsp:Transcript_89948/g.259341  ORF Transcript_89948/g.259341 Transcript_89948/m.259341 type:complete len:237 (+) Transcript_89948:428-1138(+)
MAVRKLWGLNNFEMSTTFGMLSGSLIQSSSCTQRSCKFTRQDRRGRVDAKPSLTHHIGNFSAKRQVARSSMTSLIVSSPLKPSCNSCKPRTISYTRLFMYSHSWRNTNWNGPFSSSDIERDTSSVGNFFSWTSSKISAHVCSAIAMGLCTLSSSPAAAVAAPLRLCNISKVKSHSTVRKLISALGCMPKKSGDSGGMVSMCSKYFSCGPGCGDGHESLPSAYGIISISSNSSSRMK